MENKENAPSKNNKEQTSPDHKKEIGPSQTKTKETANTIPNKNTVPDTRITIDPKKDDEAENVGEKVDADANVDANADADADAVAITETVEEPPQVPYLQADGIERFITKYLMKKPYNYTNDEEISTSLRDAFIYLMFLITLSITCFSMHNYYFYHYQQVVRVAFGHRSFVITPTSTLSYLKVQTKHDFWNFMEVNFLSIMHSLPRRSTENITEIPESRTIFRVNRLLKPPYFLQVRVVGKPCNPQYSEDFTTCYPPYTNDVLDRTPTYKGSKFYDQEQIRSSQVRGIATYYESSGYVENLDFNYNKSLSTIRRLREIDWIDRGTRLIMVQFVTFNQNANFFSLVRLKAEVLPCGFILPKIHVGNINMLSFFNQPTRILRIVFIILFLFVIYYTTVELYQIRGEGWVQYFSSMRNMVDLSILIICYALLVTNICHVKIISFYKNHIVVAPEKYDNLLSVERLSVLHGFYVNSTAVLIVISYLNFFKFISFHRAMVMLIQIFKKSAAQLFTFTLVFILIFMMFAVLGMIVFRRSNKDFLYFSTSILTTARMIAGDFELSELIRANIFWAPFFLISYMCVVVFFMINIFIAIINFNYIEIKSAPPPPETKLYEYLKKRILYLLYFFHAIKKKPKVREYTKKIDIFREEEDIDLEEETLPEDFIKHVDLPDDIDDELMTMNASLDEVEKTLERFVRNMRRIEHRL